MVDNKDIFNKFGVLALILLLLLLIFLLTSGLIFKFLISIYKNIYIQENNLEYDTNLSTQNNEYFSQNNYTDEIDSTENNSKLFSIMLYHVQWCPHCKKFMGEWNHLKNKYNQNIKFSEFDCTVNKPTDENHIPLIKGYPTILIKPLESDLWEVFPNRNYLEKYILDTVTKHND